MISTLPTGIVLLFISCVALSFFIPFFKDGVSKQVTWPFHWTDWKGFAFILLPLVLLFAAGQLLPVEATGNLRFFACAAAATFALSRLNLPARLLSIVLLAFAVLAGCALAGDGGLPLVAMLLGVLASKTADNLFFKQQSVFEDVLPTLTWLAGSYWIQVTASGQQAIDLQGLLLGSLAVGMLMRLLQGPFMFDDKLYVKRVVLSLSAGLFMLIIITKVLVLPSMTGYAVLVGVGFVFAYFFQPLDQPEDAVPSFSRMLSFLIVTGMLTLIASRLFGTVGLFVLAPAAMVYLPSNLAIYAALYWIGRGLLQAFITQFNPNVTGINLTHPYANAGLYAGLLAAVVLMVVLKDTRHKAWSIGVFLGLATLTPLISNYIVHEEPTGSLLSAALMAAVVLVAAAPVIYRENVQRSGNLLLLPLQMTSVALLSNELIGLGNTADNSLRVTVLSVLAIVVSLMMIVSSWWLNSRTQVVQVSGD